MSIIDRILGREEDQQPQQQRTPQAVPPPLPNNVNANTYATANAAPGQQAPQDPDAAAIERYRYMLKTAPPETVEQAHAEAFAQLTPQQRRQVLTEMSKGVPAAEQPQGDDPQSLARAATRAEIRQPGFMERTFGGGGMGGPMMGGMAGPSMGAMIGGSLLSSIAGSFIGSSIAHSFFDHNGGPDVVNNYYNSDGDADNAGNEAANDAGQANDASAFDGADAQGEGWGDSGADSLAGGDMDLGGGDFGGGDFGDF